MQILADVCNRCHRTVLKNQHFDSSDMVALNGNCFVYLCDMKKGEQTRPAFSTKEANGDSKLFCPDCLLEEIKEWIAKLKKRPASKMNLYKSEKSA